MAPGEYSPVQISAKFIASGKYQADLLEGDRKVHVRCPPNRWLGVLGGCGWRTGRILRFEIAGPKGHGRIVPPGIHQRVMRESIEAAASIIRAYFKSNWGVARIGVRTSTSRSWRP